MSNLVRQKAPGQAWETLEDAGGGAGVLAVATFSAVAATGLVSGVAHTVEWTAGGSAFGSGISLNGDNVTIDLADGWYQIAVSLALVSTGDVIDAQVQIALANETWSIYGPSGGVASDTAGITLTTPPILFDASGNGNSFTVSTYGEFVVDPGLDTWGVAPGTMRVWRVSTP